MNRRSFFRRTLGALAGVALAPLVAVVRSEPLITLFQGEPIPIAGQILFMGNLQVLSPRTSKVLYGIVE